MKKCLSVLLVTLLLISCIPLSASAACGIAGHRVTEPTCTEDGICRDCGIVYGALGHRYNESGICDYCGEKQEIAPDEPAVPDVPEVCAHEYADGFCIYCGEPWEDAPEVCEHQWEIGSMREPTCMEDGLWEYYCTLCYEQQVELRPATGEHLYDENGYCEYCGERQDPEECLHRWEELMFTEPTCINEGVWERYCTLCYRREVEFFPATGVHIYDDEYDAECNYCGERREVGEPEECHHQYDDSGFCIHCGQMVEVNPDLPCTHENASQPTCTTDGVCFDCGVRFSALSHAYNESGVCENCGERIEIDLPCTHQNSTPSTCTEYGFCYDCGLMFEALGHQYDENGICEYCGEKQEIDVPEDCHHEWMDLMVTEPTCIHDGMRERYCPLCSRREIVSIPATGEHIYDDDADAECNYCGQWREVKPDVPDVPDQPCTHENGRQPTCTENGYCLDCGLMFAAFGHSYNESGICEHCGEKQDITPDLPDVPDQPDQPDVPDVPVVPDVCAHEWEETLLREPTCSEDGLWEYNCRLCGERRQEFTPATGEHIYDESDYCIYCGQPQITEPEECHHRWEDLVFTEPTCINEGVWERYCTLCYRREVEFFPATGVHIYDDDYDAECNYCGEWREVKPDVPVVPDQPCTHEHGRQPTCTEDGYCLDCGLVFAAFGHSYDNGYCVNCGEKKEIEPDLPDVPDVPVVPEVCEHEYEFDCSQICALCGELTRPDATCVEQERVEARGDGVHVMNYECLYCHAPMRGYPEDCYGGEPTCHKRAECVVCGCEYGDYADHDYAAAVTDPDCVSGGYTTYTCTACGDSYVTDQTEALGHDYTAAVTDPDCVSGGYTTYTCTACGDSYVTDRTEALGHDYAAATCTKAKTCAACGATSGKKLGHTYSNACDKSCNRCKATRTVPGHDYEKKVTKATLTKNGIIKNICEECGYTASKTTTIYKISSVELSTTTYTYTGSTRKPAVTVKDSKGKKVSSSYYTVTYASGRKNVGTYKVTVKFKGNYSGTKTLTFKIIPAKTTVSKLTGAKKSLKVTVSKKSTQVTGYEVQYSTSKSFKSYKSKWLTGYKKTSLTITGLSAKKTYYVRVRTYKTVSGKKYYSGWSTVKYTKTK